MAKRLCFFIGKDNCVEEKYVEFEYIKGMAYSQKVKCALSLQKAILNNFKGKKPLEVSTKSSNVLGQQLSAFNLKYDNYYVESIFQSSKVFSNGNQFHFLINCKPSEAKKYVKENGLCGLKCFMFKNKEYPLTPNSAFYDWIYINALNQSPHKEEVLKYNAFTDIEFNDNKSVNCQARAVALFVSIILNGKKEHYLSNFENFKSVYNDLFVNKISLFNF